MRDPRETLLNLKEIMGKNSVLFLSTPHGFHIEKFTNAYDNPAHIHFFTPESLNNLLTSVGFKKLPFHSFPEMYPLSEKQSFVKEIICNIKVFAKKIFKNTQKKYLFHLVGFTKIEM